MNTNKEKRLRTTGAKREREREWLVEVWPVSLTLVEVRVRIAKASAFRESDNGFCVHAHVVERALFHHQADRLIDRQTFGRAQTMVFLLYDPRRVALFAASVVIDTIFRTISDVRARVVHRQYVKLKKKMKLD